MSKRNLKRQPDDVLIARIWQKIARTDTGCWEWDNDKQRGGYGMFWDGQKANSAHRLVYKLLVGPIPDKMCVCHKCDNRKCVNPEHLFLGTSAENSADMVAKNRQAKGDRHGSRLHPERMKPPVGSINGMAKLTESDVIAIRNSEKPVSELAKQYGLTHMGMYKVKVGLRWRHVEQDRG